MKFTRSYLSRLEDIIGEGGYVVRYERGSFKSGYCILKETRLVLINNFLPLEGRIGCLLDLLHQLPLDVNQMTDKSRKLFEEIQKAADPIDLQEP